MSNLCVFQVPALKRQKLETPLPTPVMPSPPMPTPTYVPPMPTPTYVPPMLEPPTMPTQAYAPPMSTEPSAPLMQMEEEKKTETEPMEAEPHVLHASYFGSSLLSMVLFQCRDCRTFNGAQEISFDENDYAMFPVRLCMKCQSLNRITRKMYWGAMAAPSTM